MEFVIKISQFLLSLSLLIVLHELGHFIPAKLFKTKVEKFYLFFDVKYSLFKKKIGETVYGIGWLPLGGYVKIAGMIDESMDKEQMAQPPKPWEFRSKPAWQRLIIMLGGVTVNFILAYFIFVFVAFTYGNKDYDLNSFKDGYWIENKVLNEIGLQTGDKILKVNDVEVKSHSDVIKNLITAKEFMIERDGETKRITLPEDFLGQLSSKKRSSLFDKRIPFMVAEVSDSSQNAKVDLKKGDVLLSVEGKELRYFDQLEERMSVYKNQTISASFLRNKDTIVRTLNVNKEGKIGIRPGLSEKRFEELGYFNITRREYTFAQSWSGGAEMFIDEFTGYFDQLRVLLTPSTGAYKGLGGFKAIFDIFPAFWSWEAFWRLTAFLSIMLGVLNLLPIPALDGGHVMFTLYEMVSGRKPSEKFLERAQMVGFFILIALVLFANGNDIFKAITQ